MSKYKRLIIISLCFIGLSFIPPILSSAPARWLVIEPLMERFFFKGSVDLDGLKLAWWGPQRVRGLHLKNDSVSISFNDVEINSSLFSLIGTRALTGSLSMGEGEVRHGGEKLLVQKFEYVPSPFAFQLHGEAMGKPLYLSVSLAPEAPELEASCEGFPTPIADALIAAFAPDREGMLKDLLGDKLSCQISTGENPQVKVISPALTVQARGERKGNVISFPSGVQGEYVISSRLAQILNETFGAGFFSTKNPTQIMVRTLPLEGFIDQEKRLRWNGEIKATLEAPESGLQALLGPKTECTIKGTESKGDLILQSSQLQIPHIDWVVKGDVVTLQTPFEARYTTSPSFTARSGFGNPRSSPMVITVEKAELPLKRGASFPVEARVVANQSEMHGVEIKDFVGRIEGNLFGELHYNFKSELTAPPQTTGLAALLSSPSSFDGKGMVSYSKRGFDVKDFDAEISGSWGKSDLRLALKRNGHLQGYGSVDYLLEPSIYKKITGTTSPWAALHAPSRLKFLLSTIDVPSPFEWENVLIKGEGDLDRWVVQSGDSDQPLGSVRKLRIPLHIDGKRNFISLSVTGLTEEQESKQQASITARLLLSKWIDDGKPDLDHAIFKGSLQCKSFPVAVVDSLFNQPFSALLGSTLEFKINGEFDFDKKEGGNFTYLLEGDQFLSEGALNIGETITLKDPRNPLQLDWVITPERFAIIRKHFQGRLVDTLDLKKASRLAVKGSEIAIPWLKKESGDRILIRPYAGIFHMAGTITLDMNHVAVVDHLAQQEVAYDTIKAKVATHDLFQAFHVELDAQGAIKGQETTASQITAQATVQDLAATEGKWKPQEMTLDAKLATKKAPVSLFCDIASIDAILADQFDALVGSYLDSELEAKLEKGSGVAKVEVQGTRGKLHLDGQVAKGVMTLHSPLTLEVKVTPQLGRSVLQDLIPFLSTAERAEEPIKIRIEPEGTSLPLLHWDGRRVQLGKSSIDLGQVTFTYGQQLEELLKFLSVSMKKKELLKIWFTPLYFTVDQGIAHCDRMDMLVADRFPIALWGKVDFPENKIKMTLGVSGKTVNQVFGVKGLKNEDMLQLPLKGTLDSAKLDSKKAASQVASLIAHGKGGAEGAVIGGLVDILGGTVGSKKPPKPTTTPFPWEQKRETNAEN